MQLFQYISNYQIIILAALIVSVAGDIKNHRRLRILSYFLIFTTLFEIVIANIQLYFQDRNHEALFINAHGCILFYYFIFREKKNSKTTDALIVVWTLSSLIYALNVEFTDSINTYILGLLLISALILIKFKKLIIESPYKNIWKEPHFWMGTTILIFLACSFPLLVFVEALVIEDQTSILAFGKLLGIGNEILSSGYLISALLLWKQN